jgi:hypothetical protein
VAAGHTPNLDTLQYWNEQWLHSALWYDDPRFDDDAEARAWRVVEAHAAGLSRWQGAGTRHMCSDNDDYVPTYSRPAWEEVSFDPEDGDIFDEWLNGGDDGRQEAAWEAAIAVWVETSSSDKGVRGIGCFVLWNIYCVCHTETLILTMQRGWSYWLTRHFRTCVKLFGSGESSLVVSARQRDVTGGHRVS